MSVTEGGPPQRSTSTKAAAPGIDERELTKSLLRIVLFAAAVVISVWFLSTVLSIVLLFLSAFIFSLALNGPVTWLERHGWRRGLAVLAVFLGVLAAIIGVGWLIVPRLVSEGGALLEQLPALGRDLGERLTAITGAIPGLEDALALDEASLREVLPSIGEFLGRIGSLSLSALSALVLMVVLISAMIYSLLRPQPLLRTYLEVFPAHRRDAAEAAFTEGSRGVIGWIRANVIIGGIEAVAVGVVLSVLGVPGAIIWAALAFFAELVPKLGPYLMAIPPILVALAIDPFTGLLVLVFYLVMGEVMGDVVAPMVRSREMDIHPVFLLFIFLAAAVAFGFLGALISTPMAAFLRAFYRRFYLAPQPGDSEMDARVERMLRRELASAPSD